MKKILFAIIPLLLFFAVDEVQAATTVDGFSYEVTEDNTVEITDYTLNSESVSIPSVIDGKTVTSIGYMAFYNNKSIKSVTIPDTVIEISNRAFYNCTNLNEVNLGKKVDTIRDSAFGYTSFTSIVLPDSLTVLGDSVFAGNHNLTTLNIPKNLKTIVGLIFDNPSLKNINVDNENKYYTFLDGVLFNKDKTELVAYLPTNEENSYTIPSTVKELGDGAFSHNEHLVTIVIPDSVETIGHRVFYNCTTLANINIPSSVTAIGSSVFVNCNSLVDVTIDGNFGVLMFSFFENCENLESVTFTGEIYRTYFAAFKNCPKLKTIIFYGLYELREDTIKDCPSLEKIQLSDVTQVIEKGFADDVSSSHLVVDIPDGMTENDTGYYRLYTVTLEGTYNYDQANEVLEIVNQERANAGLSELVMDEDLMKAANERAKELALRFSHDRPDNSDGVDILSKVMGENIAAGQSTSAYVMESWMNSTTHRSNILGTNYKSIGIGSYTNSGRTYWVQLFSNDEAENISTLDGKENKTEKGSLLAALFNFEIGGLSETSVNNIKVGESLTPYRIQIYNMGVDGWATTVFFEDFTYESSNKSVATVNNGVITGISTGTATIRVSMGSFSKEYDVRVYNPVTDFTLPNRVFLEVGDTTKINVKYTPNNAEVISDSWYCYDKSVIDIDSKTGIITGKKVGSVYVTYYTEGVTKGLTVTVVPKITYISLNQTNITLKEGESFKLNATISPSSYYATVDDLVTWESSNSNIASVNNGEVKANNRGEVTVTVTTIGGLKTTCKVKVLPANANSFVTKDDNNTYYYDENGEMVTGWKTIEDKLYYFNEDGVMLKGIHNVEGNNYFFGINYGYRMYGFINYEGNTYYADPKTGILATGVTEVDNNSYFFGINKFAMLKGFINHNGDYYYANSDGKLQKGMTEVNGDYYYFGSDYKAKSGLIEIDGRNYYFDFETRVRAKGVTEVGDKKYFFGIKYGYMMYGEINYNGNTYYADSDTGELASGLVEIDGRNYYFDPETKVRAKGVTEVGDKYYFFGIKYGYMMYGEINYNGNTYYADPETGELANGLIEIDGRNYYFDPKTKVRAKGVTEVDGKKYFFGIKYGYMMYNFINYNGAVYYADPTTGELASGVTIIDNKGYFFGINKNKLMYGLINHNGEYYYSNSAGILQTGNITINGINYYFDKETFKAI